MLEVSKVGVPTTLYAILTESIRLKLHAQTGILFTKFKTFSFFLSFFLFVLFCFFFFPNVFFFSSFSNWALNENQNSRSTNLSKYTTKQLQNRYSLSRIPHFFPAELYNEPVNIRKFKITTTATATGTSLNKRLFCCLEWLWKNKPRLLGQTSKTCG